MNKILKTFNLEVAIVKPYLKAILFTYMIPIVFLFINRSLAVGISFAMTFTAMTSSYTFSVIEKNDMERLYGILPVSKKELVFGKYMYTIIMGVTSLIFSIIVHPFVLKMVNVKTEFYELLFVAILGFFMFSLYTSFQIPGYYKYGSIRGRMFMYIPVVGFLIVLFCFDKLNLGSSQITIGEINPVVILLIILAITALLYFVSIIYSFRIMEQKEF